MVKEPFGNASSLNMRIVRLREFSQGECNDNTLQIILSRKCANGNIQLMRAIKTRYTKICTFFIR